MKKNASLRFTFLTALISIVGTLWVGHAYAAIVHLAGTNVDFYYDDAQTGMAVFGTPTVSGDNLIFTPGEFRAQSTDGTGLHTGTQTDTIASQFRVQAIARADIFLDGVAVREIGDYQMSGLGTQVTMGAALTIADTNDPFNTLVQLFNSTSNLSIQDSGLHAWDAFGQVDLTTAQWANVGNIQIVLENNLSAVSLTAGTSAFIQKNIIGEAVKISVLTAVPIPATVWLFGSGLLVLLAGVRKQTSMS